MKKKKVKGEIVLVLDKIEEKSEEIDLNKEILELKKQEYSNKKIVIYLKEKFNISKNKAYELVLNYNEKEKEDV